MLALKAVVTFTTSTTNTLNAITVELSHQWISCSARSMTAQQKRRTGCDNECMIVGINTCNSRCQSAAGNVGKNRLADFDNTVLLRYIEPIKLGSTSYNHPKPCALRYDVCKPQNRTRQTVQDQ